MLENNEMVNNQKEVTSLDESLNSSRSKNRSRVKDSKKILDKNNVLLRFTSCGRCSMFLASYRILYGDQAFEDAISNSYDSWLPLPWNQGLRKLLIKSYSYRLDVDVYFFENSCPECLGTYRYAEPENGHPAYLLFKI